MKTPRNRALRRQVENEGAWGPERNQALRELLDHLAQQLAREYVQLMKLAEPDTVARVPAGERKKRS
jgi:hypothetical protein